MNSGISVYRKTQVQTATPLEQIILLYEKCLSWIAKAKPYIEKKDYAEKGRMIGKAMDIVIALHTSLDPNYPEIIENLSNVYLCCLNELSLANTTNTVEPLENAEKYLKTMLDAWKEIKVSEKKK